MSKLKIPGILFLITISTNLFSTKLENIFGSFDPSYNMLGQIGLLQTPTAENIGAGAFHISYIQNDIYKYGALTISPYDWLEASYFYYRPTDLWWYGPGTEGLYLDKGFNVKFSRKINDNISIAAGLDDFAGTGYFTREYLALTNRIYGLKLNLGIGWGAFSEENPISNPLGFLADEFKKRPGRDSSYAQGGSPSFDQWFRGDAGLFYGLEYQLPTRKKVSIKIENDPFDYMNGFSSTGGYKGQIESLRKKDSNLNYGIAFQFSKNLFINISYLKGNTLNLSISFGADFSKSFFNKKVPRPKFAS